MKVFKQILSYAILTIFLIGCERDGYIDPISKVEPGSDEEPPVVILNYPTEGTAIRVKEDVTSIDIKFEVRDDIELQSIVLELNGNQIGELTEFKDYRRVVDTYTYDEVTNGEHTLTITATDMTGKSTSQTVNFEKVEPYETIYDGEIFYMPFEANFMELVSITNAMVEGSPTFASGLKKQAYQPTAGSYITFPTDTFATGNSLDTEAISATMWYKPDASEKTRAGILVISPPDSENPDAPNNKKQGFRLFREGSETGQTIKLNIGDGSAHHWFDGKADATVDPTASEWVHVAFSIASDSATVFLDGEVVSAGGFPGISWEGCDILSIGSGAPRFIGWNHLSDVGSLYDELRIYNKALTQQEVQTIMNETGN
jgi:hypothetical protein